ncbi:MAG: ATP-binding protein [Promethearchaeota archaeon]
MVSSNGKLLERVETPRAFFWPKKITGVETRHDWIIKFFGKFAMGAINNSGFKGKLDIYGNKELSKNKLLERKKSIHFGQIVPMEEVEKILDMVDSITRLPCGCRYITTGKSDKRYCFGLGTDVQGVLKNYPDASSSLENLTRAEAKKIIRKFDQEGLIHSVWTSLTPYIGGLCNCDRDCLPYRGYIRDGGGKNFFCSEYVCEIDINKCTGCKQCIKFCQFDAMSHSLPLSKVTIDSRKCFGCGVCRAACPNKAIKIIPRDRVAEVKNVW